RTVSRLIFVDLRNDIADMSRFARRQYLMQHAARWRRQIDGRLVRLELANRLIDLHMVAVLFEPLRENGFGDRFTQRGNLNTSWHVRLLERFVLWVSRRHWQERLARRAAAVAFPSPQA